MTLNLWKLSLILLLAAGIIFGANAIWNKPIIILPPGQSEQPGSGVVVTPPVVKPAAGASAAAAPYQVANLPTQKILPITYHVFQSFNNCAPAALSIALSYYDIHKTQQELAADLRPYNNPQGINDDKSTVPDELGAEAAKFGLIPYYRANGNIDLLRQFIAAGIPIVMRTLLHDNENFAHYRVVKAYDNTTRELIQDDSYENKNLRFSYDKFLTLWQQFNYEYLILVPPGKQAIAEGILGENLDPIVSWQGAVRTAQKELAENPSDLRAGFNLSVALYNTGDYQGSVDAYEKVQNRLPQITLWYQMQPIQSFFEIGDYSRVLSLTGSVLAKNVSFSELYILRGKVYIEQGQPQLAKKEFEQALFYNKNLKAAQEALSSV
jgi:tetratricopeptide (TPR) repeat protein